MATTRTHDDPAFTFTVVMERVQRETTLEEVCRTCEVSSSLVSQWRHALPQGAADQRDQQSRRKAQREEPGESLDALKKRIGELAVQNEILQTSCGLAGTGAHGTEWSWPARGVLPTVR
jgi:transposase